MTLRFFRRKTSAAETPPEEPASGPGGEPEELAPAPPPGTGGEPEESTPAPARRRRRGGSTRGSSKSRAKPAAPEATSEPEPDSATKSSTPSKTRRGRRGGGRKSAASADAPAASKTAQVTPLRPELGAPESLLEHLTERQLASLNGLQSVLSAIENRLASMSRLGGMAERPRVGIFVDVPNIVYAAERLKISIDFGKLMEFLSRDRELVRASAYAPINDDPDTALETQRFVKPFVGLGYRIVTKQLKRFSDGSTKANFDVELAIDVLTMSDRLDIVVLVSGDGDFRRLVELVASKGVRVEVIAFGESTAAELRAVADEYTDIRDHIAELRVK
ncbi:MAG: NYN domain-containing protein [Chloroflexi bacterium]|nr:NYN domain-containing protein [Chloroflexota bacterium]